MYRVGSQRKDLFNKNGSYKMTIRRRLAIILFLVGFSNFPLDALADVKIDMHKRQCTYGQNCVIIDLHCNCGGLYCQRDGDVDALNKSAASSMKQLGQCSDVEIHACAESGACAMHARPVAECTNHLCSVSWTPPE